MTVPVTLDSLVQGITGGAFSNKIRRDAQKVIKLATKSGLKLEAEAGRQVSLAIDRLENAYVKSLNLTMDKVDAVFSKQLVQLDLIVGRLTESMELSIEGLNGIIDTAQQIASTIPFADKQPQLTSFPRAIVLSSKNSSALLHFKGNFIHASHPGLTPSLVFKERKFSHIANTTQALDFQVPSEIFEKKNLLEGFISGELVIPWKKDTSDETNTATFKVLIEVLPESPGKLFIEYTTLEKIKNTQNFSRTLEHKISKKHSHYVFEVATSPGWSMDCETVQIAFPVGGHLVKKVELVGKGPGGVYYKVKVNNKHSASLKGTVTFVEFQAVDSPLKKSEEIPLQWGLSRPIQFPAQAKWKISFDSLVDETRYESTGLPILTSHVQVLPNDSAATITIRHPESGRLLPVSLRSSL